VFDTYLQVLARMHAIDPSEFAAAGVAVPSDPTTLVLGLFEGFYQRYREERPGPEAAIEFIARWVRRNVPRITRPPTIVTGDCGQFLFEDGRLTAVLDLELAYLGDPLVDLANLRLRDRYEPLSDLAEAFRRYAELTGTELDLDVIEYHTVWYAVCSSMSMSRVVNEVPPDGDFTAYLDWYIDFTRFALEIMARFMGVELERPALPAVVPSPNGRAARALLGSLATLTPDDGFDDYQHDVAVRTARYLETVVDYGDRLAADDLDDIAGVLGVRPTDWIEAEARLERFVESAGSEHDAALVALFFRRIMRQRSLLEPALASGSKGYPNRRQDADPLEPLERLMSTATVPADPR
jgi:hypothetical protein